MRTLVLGARCSREIEEQSILLPDLALYPVRASSGAQENRTQGNKGSNVSTTAKIYFIIFIELIIYMYVKPVNLNCTAG